MYFLLFQPLLYRYHTNYTIYLFYPQLSTVETMAAGPGNLEVTVNGGRVPTAAAAQGAHTYAISFTPRDPRPHTVELRFNGDHVPGMLQYLCNSFDLHTWSL